MEQPVETHTCIRCKERMAIISTHVIDGYSKAVCYTCYRIVTNPEYRKECGLDI